MGKIMGKLKHNYDALPELQTKFCHKQCVIWSFLQSFNEFHHNFHIFKIPGNSLEHKLTFDREYCILIFLWNMSARHFTLTNDHP